MAKCRICGQEMLTANGCSCEYVTLGEHGKRHKRIFMGEENDFYYLAEPGDRCHDCGALYGYPHHDGCDAERCPVCGEQFIGCDCDIYYEDTEIENTII